LSQSRAGNQNQQPKQRDGERATKHFTFSLQKLGEIVLWGQPRLRLVYSDRKFQENVACYVCVSNCHFLQCHFLQDEHCETVIIQNLRSFIEKTSGFDAWSLAIRKIEVLKSEMRSGFGALGAALENAVLRGELSTTREIADLRIRVERLEKEHGQLQ
jgi:hypothetical protein